jgi:uncharacterized protein (DUF2236 family)
VSVNPITRKVNREIVVVFGWGPAILLQLAHPLVATAVNEHSGFRRDLFGYVTRARRTIGAMLALTFGTETTARASADAINAIHDRVSGALDDNAGAFTAGTRYSAHDPELLRWVHATLMHEIPLAYELLVGPLTSEERDQYYVESSEMEAHLGMPRGFLPRNRADLEHYLETMFSSGQLCVTDTARHLASNLLSPHVGPVPIPFAPARRITMGLLPPQIRSAYGFRWSEHDEAAFKWWARAVKRTRALTPRVFREWPQARRGS